MEEDVTRQALLNDALISGIEAFRGEHGRGQRCIQETWLVQSINELMGVLNPHLAFALVEPKGRVVIGTVEEDVHGLGEDLVKLMLDSAGSAAYDRGTDVSADDFAQSAGEHGADIVALSAMLSTTRGRMHEVIEKLKARGIRDQGMIMSGVRRSHQTLPTDRHRRLRPGCDVKRGTCPTANGEPPPELMVGEFEGVASSIC